MATFTVPARSAKTKMDLNSTQSLVDPEWELIDPIPDVHKLFVTFNNKFFVGKLACVELEWSKRMYQCAGICYSRGNRHHMSCVIRLSEPLLKLRSRKELIETLLHEMIHAWNFIRGVREENGGHGPQFLSKMTEINHLAGTNITVYHTFHDEVELYKTHWWRCDGPCRARKPFYGYVKRTSNRAPSKYDFWWSQHQSTCGGTFIKIKEPEKKARKKAEPKATAKKSAATSRKPAERPKSGDIRKFFSPDKSPIGGGGPSSSAASDDTDSSFNESLFINDFRKKEMDQKNPQMQTGNTLGGTASGRSRLLDLFDNSNAAKKRKLTDVTAAPIISLVSPPPMRPPPFSTQPVRKSIINQIKDEFGDDDDIIFIDDEFDDTFGSPPPPSSLPPAIKPEAETTQHYCNCPVCNENVKSDLINQHLDECLTLASLQ